MIEIDLGAIASGLVEIEPGLWASRAEQEVAFDPSRSQRWFEAEDDSVWFSHRNQVIVGVVAEYPPSGPLFDIGGGNGFVARGLADMGFPTVVVEPVPAAARNALARSLRPVVNATFDAVDFASGSVPAVAMFDVLEHIDDDVGYLGGLLSRLAPGGRVYLTVPAYGWLWSDHDVAAGHRRRYTGRHLKRVVREAGLELDYLSYFFGVLPLPVFLGRTLPSLGGRRRRDRAVWDATTGSRSSGRVLRRVLAREQRRLPDHRGRVGTSIIAVARAPGRPVSSGP